MDVNVGMVIQIFKLGVVSIFSGGGLKFENNLGECGECRNWENFKNCFEKVHFEKARANNSIPGSHALLLFSYPTGGNKDEIRIIRALYVVCVCQSPVRNVGKISGRLKMGQ